MRAAMILGPILLLAGCNVQAGAHDDVKPSGKMGQKQFQVGSFDEVALGGPHNVVIAVGGAPSVRAEGDTALLDALDIRVDGSKLKIDAKNRHWSFGHHGSRGVTVYVTVPSLAGASIGGSGDMSIDKVQGDRFSAAIGGSGSMKIGPIKVGRADLSIAGSGGITTSGSAEQSQLSIAGSGDIEAGGLQSRTTRVSIAGSGSVSTQATETADVSVMGSGDVSVGGTAKCTVHKMGSGNVRCGA